jgi:hypothetical protein
VPLKKVIARARADARSGKAASTQAGEFVREEMRQFERGNPRIQSRRQAIAIGLSEARRAGVKLPAPKKGTTSAATRRKAAQDTAKGRK